MDVPQLRVVDDLLHDGGLLLDWTNDPTDADMGPDKRCVGMALEQRLHLGRISRFGAGLGKGDVDVVMNQNYEPDFGCKVDESIERIPYEC